MKRNTLPFAALFLALVLFAVQSTVTETAKAASVPAPSFSGKTIDGKPFSSSSLKGKGYIVNFFATWCPPCRAEIPDMVEIQKKYEKQGFTFVGMAVNETGPKVQSFIKSKGINYPVLMATQELIQTFNGYKVGGISGIPTSFVVDVSGQLIGVIVGPRSLEQFEQIVNAALNSKAVKSSASK
ncbi:MAG TPA: TlpA family protein disulfide reductase [Chlorobaculum parvum]|uniref:TlpA family protein disulfide reductase n=1 Tax=Chlorobaculum parvum TaxID=274539 RepID=A0A7C5DD66_9CHLB|nr:TlpA family protein disulfide reductase [Chlorobaculum parvum]